MPWPAPGVDPSAFSSPCSSLITVMGLLIPGEGTSPLHHYWRRRRTVHPHPRPLVLSWEHLTLFNRSRFSSSSFCTFFHEKSVCRGTSPQQSLPLGNQGVLTSYPILTLLPKYFTKSHPYTLTLWDLGFTNELEQRLPREHPLLHQSLLESNVLLQSQVSVPNTHQNQYYRYLWSE